MDRAVRIPEEEEEERGEDQQCHPGDRGPQPEDDDAEGQATKDERPAGGVDTHTNEKPSLTVRGSGGKLNPASAERNFRSTSCARRSARSRGQCAPSRP